MRLAKLMVLLLSIAVAGAGCSSGQASENGSEEKLTVFAAAHLTEAFKDAKKAFEDKTGIDVTISFAGTQIIRTQIEHGAPADVFASANLSHMKALEKKGLVQKHKKFAYNTMALIVPKSNPAGIHSLKDLAKNGLRLVVGVDTVPVGIYTREILEKANKEYGSGYKKKVMANVVSLETNVKKVAGKVTLGEADAGIVYVTDLTKEVRKKVKVIDFPKDLNVVATDTIAVVKDAEHPETAKKWIQFVMSEEGQNILAEHNLIKLEEGEGQKE